ncbi:STM4015 family protein [Actinomadura parmotrematis]|uniref:STM4015 family protein n=1 Tax=Actinomadura parmotrematis TaxID=2864039 RepID=A0ABS7FXI3_9ACTN|nr:STM4015 family protein [Actinomadura parmotrematis]MBW8484870.1 STM4015 family protein [Actinomadura parmotrematis]
MTFTEHLAEFAGLPVVTHGADGAGPPPAADAVAWRITSEGQAEDWEGCLDLFEAEIDAARVTTLVVGSWWQDRHPLEILLERAASYPALRALMLGDVLGEECEVSWIVQGDVTPLLEAFPRLEVLAVRGADVQWPPVESGVLRELRFESGGLPVEVVRGVAASDLPALESLALMLGDSGYGGDTELDDLAPFLDGARFPALRHLGVENCEFTDRVAAALAAAPVVARLESLSLALGTLSDAGAEALLSGQPLTHLRRLDLHHHFLSEGMVERLRAALPDTEIDAGEPLRDDARPGFIYIAVAE